MNRYLTQYTPLLKINCFSNVFGIIFLSIEQFCFNALSKFLQGGISYNYFNYEKSRRIKE